MNWEFSRIDCTYGWQSEEPNVRQIPVYPPQTLLQGAVISHCYYKGVGMGGGGKIDEITSTEILRHTYNVKMLLIICVDFLLSTTVFFLSLKAGKSL